MYNALYSLIQKFFSEMDMSDSLARIVTILSGSILAVAALGLLFGYKLFRFISAVVAFLLTAVGISLLLGSTGDRAVVVTAFIVLGILLAFLAYQWTEFGAFILCASIGFGLAALLTELIWVQILAALVFGVISIRFPVTSIILSTSVWGGITLGTDGAQAVGIDLIRFRVLIILGLIVLGILVQYFTNRDDVRKEISFLKNKSGKRRPNVRKPSRKRMAGIK